MNKFIKLAAACMLGVALASASNEASAFSLGSGTRILGTSPTINQERTKKLARAPLAYQVFCLQNPRECKKGGKSTVAYSGNLMAKLHKANRSVNRKMKWTADRREIWSLNGRRGDCEDFALSKKSLLVKMGVPSGALRMAVVKTRKGEGHAVLVVKTTRGDYVLDNTTNLIKPKQRTNFKWVGVASTDPTRWERL